MPDDHGRIRPIAFPGAPWCVTCKMVACICAPASKPLPVAADHPNCGTPMCCRSCNLP